MRRSPLRITAALRAELRWIPRRRPRWGYLRAHQLLLDEGWRINRSALNDFGARRV
ncbi:MAG: hypothetical protein JO325_17870 [Solirubrobacterales bacterium]|nr:hypothetical protein [Solirubrobacterales bacterium]